MKICGLQKTTLLDYPGHVACTVFTGGCNFRCPFCHNSELITNDAEALMDEEEFFKFLDKRCHTLEGVAITGGEPTVNKDLPDFIRRIKGCYGLNVKLDTNGTNFVMLDELFCEGLVDYVAMDVKAGFSNYSKLAGVEISDAMFENIQKNLHFIMQDYKIFNYELRTTVVGGLHTEADFEEIGQLIKGAKRYYLQCYKNSDNVLCKDRGFYSPSKEDMLKYKAIAEKYVDFVEIRGMD